MSQRLYSLEIRIPCSDDDRASHVISSLDPDNEGYVNASLSEGVVTFRTESTGAGRLRQTADDLMTCLGVVEDVLGALR